MRVLSSFIMVLCVSLSYAQENSIPTDEEDAVIVAPGARAVVVEPSTESDVQAEPRAAQAPVAVAESPCGATPVAPMMVAPMAVPMVAVPAAPVVPYVLTPTTRGPGFFERWHARKAARKAARRAGWAAWRPAAVWGNGARSHGCRGY